MRLYDRLNIVNYRPNMLSAYASMSVALQQELSAIRDTLSTQTVGSNSSGGVSSSTTNEGKEAEDSVSDTNLNLKRSNEAVEPIPSRSRQKIETSLNDETISDFAHNEEQQEGPKAVTSKLEDHDDGSKK